MIRPTYQQETFPHWTELPIRFRDLDPLNHVNNAIFSTYYEEARVSFIQQVPAFKRQLQTHYNFLLANLNIDFIRPIEYPAELLVGSGIKELGTTSITSFQAIYTKEDKTLSSVAHAKGVWFDMDKQRPAKLPELGSADNFELPQALFE